jgi:RimJ/RimL family protein N-acetyltransferase
MLYELPPTPKPKYVPLINQDQHVANWCWQAFRLHPYHVNCAIGILNEHRELCGAALFHWYNGSNIELSYYGASTATLGIGRFLARIALYSFSASRVTIHTDTWNKTVIKGMKKLGFEHECIVKGFYGENRDAVQMVLHRDGLIRIAGKIEGLH